MGPHPRIGQFAATLGVSFLGKAVMIVMKLHRSLTIAMLLAAAIPVSAHHSFSAQFNTTAPTTITGTITSISKVAPHVYFLLTTRDSATGKTTTTKVQICAPWDLVDRGLTDNRFKVGATVVVRGAQAKTDKTLIGGITLTFPDGTVADKLNEWGPRPK
jgi:hypothetical protein